MKIISHLFEHLHLQEGKCNLVYFKDSRKEYLFRQQLKEWNLKKEQEQGIFFIMQQDKEMNIKDVEYLELHGGSNDYIQIKLLHQWVKFQIQNDVNYFESFEKLRIALEKFFFEINLNINGVELEFVVHEQILDALLKTAGIEISTDNDEPMNAIAYRQFMIEIWLQLIFTTKPKFVVYFYPECDGIGGEMLEFLEILEKHQVTALCFTKNESLIKKFDLDQVHFIKQNGSFYQTKDLMMELQAFDLVEGKKEAQFLAVGLAVKDFEEEYTLLDQKYKHFLQSKKF